MQQPQDPFRGRHDAAVFGDITLPIRALPFWDGVQWWVGAWTMVSQELWRWFLTLVVFLLLCFLALFIPLLGTLLQHLLQTVLIGGVMFGFHAQAHGRRPEVSDLFAGFRGPYLMRLCGAALIITVAFIAFFLVVGIGLSLVGLSLAMTHLSGLTDPANLPVILLLLLLLVFAVSAVGMFYWFAPALIMLHDVGPIEALRLSFVASMRNIGPMLSFSIVALVPVLLALIPLGMIGEDGQNMVIGLIFSVLIGLVVLVLFAPMMFGAMYVSTERIFGAAPANARS